MNPLWIDVARSGAAQRLATWPWRLGLGWLVGRRFALLSTQSPQGAVRRTLVPAHIVDGDVLLAGLDGAHWQEDIEAKPVVNVQVHPGPLAAKVRPASELSEHGPVRWWVASAAGGIAPEMVGPDRVWAWGVAAPLLWRLGRSRR